MKECQKILNIENKVVIVADYREKEIISYLKTLGAKVTEQNLEVSDFVCSEKVGIERKTHSDFVSSIIDGRIFEQAEKLKNSFERPIIIIEGYSNREINDNALKGAIAALLTDFGISLVSTKNSLDSAKMIYWIAKREQTEKRVGVRFKVRKKSFDEKILKEQIVASLPGISNVLSKRLLEHFGTIEKIFCADEEELKKVKGIGKVLAKKIRKILTENYR